MIQLTWYQINEHDFVNGIVTLNKATGLEAKTAYRAGRVLAACKRATELCRAEEKKLIVGSPFALKNAEGKELAGDDGFPMVDPKHHDAFMKSFKKMAEAHVINIKVMPLDFEQVTKAGLNGIQIVALAPLLTNLPEDETGEVEFSETVAK